MGKLAQYFEFSQLNTHWRQEYLAGITTFLTMVYIVMVNPAILSNAGVDQNTAFVATCIVAGIGSILCGLWSNYPIALAPSMGLNAYFTYSVVANGQLALGQAFAAVFIAGLVFIFLTLFRIRDWLLQAIPPAFTHAIGAGIGLFIGFIGLKSLGIVVGHPNTLVALGTISSLPVLLGFIGLCFMIFLDTFEVPGAILLPILAVTLIGHFLGISKIHGFLSAPPHINPSFHIIDFHGLLTGHSLMIIFTFLLVALFDSTGTLLSLLYQAGLAGQTRIIKRLSRAFLSESLVTMLGGLLGTSTTGPYIENASGIAVGGKSGVTAITVGALFLLTLWFAPFATSIPVFAYAPALIFIAYKMCLHLGRIDWNSPAESFPAVFIILLIPLTFSIANGIACGFVIYIVTQASIGNIQKLPWSTWILFAVFVLYLSLVNHF